MSTPILLSMMGAKYPSIGAVTTNSPQTVVIQEWNATAQTTIDWGDGSTTIHPAATGTTISHIYATAGTYVIRLVVNPLAVTRMDFRGVGLRIYSALLRQCKTTVYFQCSNGPLGTINSADISAWRPADWRCYTLPSGFTGVINSSDIAAWRPASWRCYNLPSGFTGVINSSDMSAWRPTDWYCFTLPSGFTGVINSSDMSAWRPTNWQCYSLPSGFTGVINSSDMSAWRPVEWHCYSLPADMRPLVVAAVDFASWITPTSFLINSNSLNQTQVDAVLLGIYSAFATKTSTGGVLGIAGNNAAPSGTLQAECPPTTGKTAAYELVNDSCGVSTKHWTTVTITT